MRVAVVSDIHGNLTALEAVLRDLRETTPDLILHGGDLAAPGSRPTEVVDIVHDLGWQGVLGNADEMLTRPESLSTFAAQSTAPQSMWAAIAEMAAAARDVLGEARLAWMRELRLVQNREALMLVHASPEDCWRSPGANAGDAELQKAYAGVAQTIVVYGHIHVPFVRTVGERTIANSGSVGQPLDGDRRAAYLLIDDSAVSIRRVEYEVHKEIEALRGCGLPHAEWLVRMLESARPQLP